MPDMTATAGNCQASSAGWAGRLVSMPLLSFFFGQWGQSKKLKAIECLELPLARPPRAGELPLELVTKQPSMSRAIALCMQASGLDDKEVYLTLGIDAGHWSRIVKGDAHFPINKLGQLMDVCGNDAPLMWLANARGYGLVILQTEAERRAEAAEQALAVEREKVRLLTELMQGRGR